MREGEELERREKEKKKQIGQNIDSLLLSQVIEKMKEDPNMMNMAAHFQSFPTVVGACTDAIISKMIMASDILLLFSASTNCHLIDHLIYLSFIILRHLLYRDVI